MTDTIHLGMPFIEGSQAQKHVTHNEALRILDAVIQIGVRDSDRTEPPLSPAEGDRHIVASGAAGAWADHAHAVAVYEDGAWRYLTPKPGWCAWSAADGALLVFDGESWIEAVSGGGGGIPDSVDRLGINGPASDPNLLTVTSNAALFDAIAVADDGTGDMRVQISKEDSSSTASVVFSNAFEGRAEFGLVESDSFKLKMSSDGETFVEAMTFDSETGNAAFQRGIAFTGVVSPPQIMANRNDYAPDGFAAASALRLSSDASRTITGLAGGSEGRTIVVHNVGSNNIVIANQDSSSDAANRFLLGSNVTLGADAALSLRYDATTQRWRALSPTGGGEGGGGAAGMTGSERRNFGLGLIYQSKLFAESRRLANVFATGFKGASDALNGILTGSSSNYTVTPGTAGATTGNVAPTTVAPTIVTSGSTTPANGPFTGFNGTTYINNTTALVNGSTYTKIGVYANAASTWTMKIVKRNSSTSVDVVVSQSFSHPGGGWADLTLSSPYTVPGSGAYYVGGYLATDISISVNSSQTRAVAGSDIAGSGQAVTEASGSPPSFRASTPTAVNSMTLVTAMQTTDAAVSNGRVLLEFDDANAPVLDTDLTVGVTCDGGAHWTAASLSAVTSHSQGGRKVAETADQACTSGTSFAARIKTLNNKNVPVYGLSLTVH